MLVVPIVPVSRYASRPQRAALEVSPDMRGWSVSEHVLVFGLAQEMRQSFRWPPASSRSKAG